MASVPKGHSPFQGQGQIRLLSRVRPKPSLQLRWSLGMDPEFYWHWFPLPGGPGEILGITP